ncbi:DUF1802 family protein [Paenibacillus oleatilyticus]|uniref:DUF1802 family protein n=1 Tax=Paenibacillus oleatilyticus TaxID=2594886 RepID=UPI001C1F91CB|nr:DUF1802 family protein [Paenibacillus oleatilyticus]MBU7320321.1 DUF1802 family protein [Paenibacillus oleatilyticus]
MIPQGQAVGLKEWAVAVEALKQGEQILIMRKGGIREETRDFQVESESFYLYPTYEHQRKELIKPAFAERVDERAPEWSGKQAEIGCYVELAEDILIETEEQLAKLKPFHIWTDRLAEERLKWKWTKPLHVMLLRVYALDEPVRIPVLDEYNGCKSWIGLPESLHGAPRRPVLTDEAFAIEANRIREALAQK